jgi:multicomponent Na+:H+ antiporter subunit D
MHDIESARVLIPLLVPALTAVLIMGSGRWPNVRESWSVIGAIVTFVAAMSMMPQVTGPGGGAYTLTLFEFIPNVAIRLRVDGMSLLFAGVSSFLWILAGFYCVGYMRGLHEHAQTRFYTCYAATIFGAVGVAFSASLVTLYLFYELVSIFTYPLVMHHQDADAYDGSRKYITYLMVTSKVLLLPALVLVYVTTGTLDFATNIHSGIFPSTAGRVLVTVVYFLSLFGYAKAALMPFHNWLPSAMVAPTPVSALLHAVAVVKVGVFSICRVMLYVFGVDLLQKYGLGLVTAYLASFTILAGSAIALTKDNLKARLAYSTISQLSYIVLGVALLSQSGITGGLIHIPNHAFSKITLFFCAGAIMVAHRKTEISQMDGIGYQMPWTMAAFGLASLSMIGVPPVAGFVTKWYLAIGTMQIHSIGLLVVLLASSLLNAGYFVPVVLRAFFPRNGTGAGLAYAEASPYMVVPLFLTAVLSVVFGFYPDLFLKLIEVVR